MVLPRPLTGSTARREEGKPRGSLWPWNQRRRAKPNSNLPDVTGLKGNVGLSHKKRVIG